MTGPELMLRVVCGCVAAGQIGSDAEQKWKIIHKRQEEKVALLKGSPDKNGSHIRRNADNHYELVSEKEKNAFEKNFGEGTAFDLDYGKLLIIALCIYIAVKVS